jgi:hypothetical protein
MRTQVPKIRAMRILFLFAVILLALQFALFQRGKKRLEKLSKGIYESQSMERE